MKVTHTVLVTPQVIQRIEKLNTPYSQLMVSLLNFFTESYEKVFFFKYPPLHDPVAMACVINPSIFQVSVMTH
jgi:purine nucleosidase